MCFQTKVNYKRDDRPFAEPEATGKKVDGYQGQLTGEQLIFPLYTGYTLTRTGPQQLTFNEMQWGFVFPNIKDEAAAKKQVRKYSTHNARIETLDSSRVYAPAFVKPQTRCIMLVTSYFEAGHEIYREDGSLLYIASIWNPWQDKKTFTMVTTEPNDLLADCFRKATNEPRERMPAHLTWDEAQTWLDPDAKAPDLKGMIMEPRPSEGYGAVVEKK